MSKRHRAAARREAPRFRDANPSQSARPGSLQWTCGSTTPGKTCSPVASIVSRALALEVGPDGGDQAVGDADVTERAPGRGDHGAAANEEVERRSAASLPRPRPVGGDDRSDSAVDYRHDGSIAAGPKPRDRGIPDRLRENPRRPRRRSLVALRQDNERGGGMITDRLGLTREQADPETLERTVELLPAGARRAADVHAARPSDARFRPPCARRSTASGRTTRTP